MSFLAPLFFAGLVALAVPILVHLTHKERKDVVVFPSLMFLTKIPYQAVRRQRIRHWLLFALRCLALILLALAFARPFLPSAATAAPVRGVGARELVILLDRSYSMSYGDRWTRAVDAARRAITGLSGDDRASLVLFDGTATAATEPTADQAILGAALEAAKPGAGITRYEPAFRLAQRVLVESELPRREVLVISDFQRVGWDGRDSPALPAGTTIERVDLSAATTSNIAVTAVDFRRDYAEDRERVAITARLVNRSAEARPRQSVSLELNGRAVETKQVDLAPNAAATVDFAPAPLPSGTTRGVVRSADDALVRDNAFFFAISRGQALSVLVIDHREGGAPRSLYVERALGIGSQPNFRVTTKRLGSVTASDLVDRSLVLINDSDLPGGELGRRLVEYVNNGGGLLVALGDRSAPRERPAYAAELLPATADAPIDRTTDRGGTLGYIDRSHPIFEVFSAPRSGDFSTPRFFRYRSVTPGPGDEQLARFDDGHIALLERKVGRGRVIVFTSSFDGIWNDLPLQPVFLPVAHQLAKYAAAYADERPWSVVGQVANLPGIFRDSAGQAGTASEVEYVAVAPSGERTRLAGTTRRTVELTEQGFYEMQRVGSRGGPRVVAVNVDLAESDLTAVEPQLLTGAMVAGAAADTTAGAEASTPVDIERRQG
ncbi:MAG: double-transrane region domain protein, partial [Geminicoccaceae bacterium]|nr:double-transrane region domain protein [Geminicoccaceae bacterium]